jgi:hypothetical protein
MSVPKVSRSARQRGALLALILLCTAMGAALGGGLYEGIVVNPMWSQDPPRSFALIQPDTGVPLQSFWIPIHAAITVGLLLALVLSWPDRGVRRVLLVGLAAYVVMRAWSFAYFIPEMLAFQEVPVGAGPDPELAARVDRWVGLTWLRLPLDLIAWASFLAALRRSPGSPPLQRFAPAALVIAAVIGTASCSCSPPFRDCAEIEPELLATLPDRLSATGLYADITAGALAEDVYPFTPRFELWSDSADKRRWIYLPPGTTIDTREQDSWVFPAGTKLWKEFVRDGTRVETRLLFKHGPEPEAWTPVAYLWDGDDAWIATGGAANAAGTAHDVPSAAQCRGCHGGIRSGVLGFSAVQLPVTGAAGGLDLATLASRGWLTAPPPDNALPGDATAQAALGYLHANCGHCHNQDRPPRNGPRCFDPERDFDFLLRTAELERLEFTATYRTAVGRVIDPGNGGGSSIVVRMRSRDPWWGMPALGTEDVDTEGVELVKRWIDSLPPE